MEDPRAREIALFRYSLVREASDARLSQRERGVLVRALSQVEHTGPDGRRVRVGRSTIDRWVLALRRGGFEALVPTPRPKSARTDPSLLGLAEALKREAPARTAAQVARVMAESGAAPPSVRTLQRYFARLGLTGTVQSSPPRAYGRFEASRPNEHF